MLSKLRIYIETGQQIPVPLHKARGHRTKGNIAFETVEDRLDKIDGYLTQYGLSLPDTTPLVADLLSVPFEQRYTPPEHPPERRKQLVIDAITTSPS